MMRRKTLIRQYERLIQKNSEIQEKLQEVKRHLSDSCLHEKTGDYLWINSDGHGTHTSKLGKACMFCDAVDSYNNDHWVRREDLKDWDD